MDQLVPLTLSVDEEKMADSISSQTRWKVLSPLHEEVKEGYKAGGERGGHAFYKGARYPKDASNRYVYKSLK